MCTTLRSGTNSLPFATKERGKLVPGWIKQTGVNKKENKMDGWAIRTNFVRRKRAGELIGKPVATHPNKFPTEFLFESGRHEISRTR